MTKHREVAEGRAVFVTVLKAMDTEQVVDFIVKENSSSWLWRQANLKITQENVYNFFRLYSLYFLFTVLYL